MRMRNINDRREQRVRARRRARRCSMWEKPRERPCNSAFTQLPVLDVARGRKGVGVMATCNNIVDSYCFVIGPCDAMRRVRFAERCGGAEYIAEVVLLEISRGPLRDFRNFFRSRGGRDDAALLHVRFLPAHTFLRFFFFNSFLYFFSREWHRVKFEAFE